VKPEAMGLKRIDSTHNPAVKGARGLLRGRRRAGDEFIIEGPHLLEAALDAGADIRNAFVTEEFVTDVRYVNIFTRLKGTGSALFLVPGRIMEAISDVKTPQGVCAVASYSEISTGEVPMGPGALIAVCDGISEPGNLGAIIRAADAFGAGAVVLLPGTCDPFGPKALRATAGSIFNVPVAHAETGSFLLMLRTNGVRILASSSHADKTIAEADFSTPVAIVFGNEAGGVSQDIMEAAETVFRIPILGGAESLNVAASAAICLYEAASRAWRR